MSKLRQVVMTGMDAITPLAHSAGETWKAMKQGLNGIRPTNLFDTANFKTKPVAEVRNFDLLAYMEHNDAPRANRYAQFAVAAASQAVEKSGVIGALAPERVAMYIGIGGIATFETEHFKLPEKDPRRVSPLFIPMMIANMAAEMITIHYDCRGCALPSVTACASGSNAIGEAMRLIRHGHADAVITGGAEVPITPSAVAGFVNMQALSTLAGLSAL